MMTINKTEIELKNLKKGDKFDYEIKFVNGGYEFKLIKLGYSRNSHECIFEGSVYYPYSDGIAYIFKDRKKGYKFSFVFRQESTDKPFIPPKNTSTNSTKTNSSIAKTKDYGQYTSANSTKTNSSIAKTKISEDKFKQIMITLISKNIPYLYSSLERDDFETNRDLQIKIVNSIAEELKRKG